MCEADAIRLSHLDRSELEWPAHHSFYSRARLLSIDVGIYVKCIACGHEFRSRFQEDRIETYEQLDTAADRNALIAVLTLN